MSSMISVMMMSIIMRMMMMNVMKQRMISIDDIVHHDAQTNGIDIQSIYLCTHPLLTFRS